MAKNETVVTKDSKLVCPACGSTHLTMKEMTADGPIFDCGGCAMKPVLNLVSDGEETKLFWSL